MRCVEPIKIIEILRLGGQGFTQQEIAASVKCSKSTVRETQRRCREAGQRRAWLCGHTTETGEEQARQSQLSVGRIQDGEPRWSGIQPVLLSV